MDPSLYAAAKEGDVVVLTEYIGQPNVQVTYNGNTILHVAAQFGQLQVVKKILEERLMLLNEVNITSETPLHIAAREGHYDIVKALIECVKQQDLEYAKQQAQQDLECAKQEDLELEGGGEATKEMLRATNKDKDTALHMAVRSNHLHIVQLLTQEDRVFQNSANNAKETPLYLAAESGYESLVLKILENCTSPCYGGPDGRTALHAAVIRPWYDYKGYVSKQTMRKLLEGKLELIKEADEHGWTALHYAARCGNAQGVEVLLEMDKSVAYITTADKDHQSQTALHIAAANGYVPVMREILSKCPDCWEMVNGKGQNVLHIALDMLRQEVIEFIEEESWISRLKKQKDIDGNTPIHLYFAAFEETKMSSPAKKKLTDKVNVLLQLYEGDHNWAFNNQNMIPMDIKQSFTRDYPSWSWNQGWGWWSIGSSRNIVNQDQECITKMRARREENKKEKERVKEAGEKITKMGETNLIVAILIVTITFAAGFTIPGGYDSNEGPKQGMPILIREAAFKVFVITNTIALICSTSSVFLYVSASLYDLRDEESKDKRNLRYEMALWLILIAAETMTVAFITGSYAMLAHFLGLAISVCVIGCISLLICFTELKNLGAWSIFKTLMWRRP